MQFMSLAVGVFWKMEQLVAFSMLTDSGSPSFPPQVSCLSLKLHVIVLPNKAPAQTCLSRLCALWNPGKVIRVPGGTPRLPLCGVSFTDLEYLNMIRIRTERSFNQLDLVANSDIESTEDTFSYMCTQLRRGQDWI